MRNYPAGCKESMWDDTHEPCGTCEVVGYTDDCEDCGGEGTVEIKPVAWWD